MIDQAKLDRGLGLVILLLVVVFNGCTQPFTPNMPYEKRLVVYAVLSNGVLDHKIRVYTTYDYSNLTVGESGPDTHVENAVVLMEDVTMAGSVLDTCQYDHQTQTYMWSPAGVVRGHRYRLSIAPETMTPVHAEVVVPSEAIVAPGSVLTLREPSTYTSDFVVSARLAPEAKAYIVRLFVDYEYLVGGVWTPGRIEVPQSSAPAADGSGMYWIYPSLTKRLGSDAGGDTGYQLMSFDHDAYLWAISQVQSSHLVQGLRFQRAVVHLTQVDVHLYNYYSIANGFQDPYTIRTDGPDYTNIKGGYGVLGASVQDSTSIGLPEFVR